MANEQVILEAEKRTVIGKQVKALRRAGKMPAVVYGRHISPISLQMDAREANHILSRVGSSHLITLKIAGEDHTVLVRDRQRDFIRGGLIHVDFLEVSMTETLTTFVRLELVGTASAVSDFDGILVTGVSEVEIECLPKDLPDIIEVDISTLTKIGASILVEDITMPPQVTLLSSPQDMVVQVISQMGEEAPLPGEEPAAIEPEVLEKGKKEEGEEEE